MKRISVAIALACAAAAALAQQPSEPPRRLQISVRFDDTSQVMWQEIGVGGTVSNRGSRVEVRGGESQTTATGLVEQRVMALDGRPATIYLSQSRPVRQRQYVPTPVGPVPQEITVVQEAGIGFQVVPHISGDTVTMEIVSSSTASMVRGRLGEWFELGATAGAAGSRSVWVRVDALD